MCESNVFLITNGTEELVMENVAVITPTGKNRFLLKGLLGDAREVEGVIRDINLMAHKITLETA